jgi:hypothetical protein
MAAKKKQEERTREMRDRASAGVLSMKSLAVYLDVSLSHAKSKVYAGEIPSALVAGKRVVLKNDAAAYVAASFEATR